MWSQIVSALIVIIVATYALQLFVPRARAGSSATNVRWDIAPVMGFFGVLLLALSLTEAYRRSVIDAWLWGGALGSLVGFGASIFVRKVRRAPQRNESALWATIRFIRAYGTLVLIITIGIYLSVRIFGPAVEVFIAGAGGVFIVVLAFSLFMRGRIQSTGESRGK